MDRLKALLELEEQAAAFYENGAIGLNDTGVVKIFKTLSIQTAANLDMLNTLIDSGRRIDSDKEAFGVNIFKCLDDCGCAMIRAEELATYVSASDIERKIISQYAQVRSGLADIDITKSLDIISKKHKDALFVLNDMIDILNRSSDWVESAEFNIVEPY